MSSVISGDFQPINEWQLQHNGPKWKGEDSPLYLMDQTTKRLYWNESKRCVRVKCLLLSLATPFAHSAFAIKATALRILKLGTFYHFWSHKKGEKNYSLKSRAIDAGIEALKIVVTPFAIVGLELAAIYGLFTPYNGRKLYATIERALYGRSILAPCFQPNPKSHAFGGDPNKRNAY